MKPEKLPETDSIDELARFWDSRDLTDFEDELEEVAEPVFERATTVTLRLESGEAAALRRVPRRIPGEPTPTWSINGSLEKISGS